MLFTSWVFLVFLALFCLAYWTFHGRARLWTMFLFSLVFYGWWDWRFIALLLFSAVLDYNLGIWIADSSNPRRRRALVVTSVIINLSFLGFFKYFNFFADSAAQALRWVGVGVAYQPLHIILPVGISFYVFKTMSYTIDVYRGRQASERDLLRYTTFVVFFPELVAGPIVRASRMLPQLREDHPFEFERMLSGAALISSGYVRKAVIADSLAPLVDVRFAHPETQTALSLLLGVYFYAFQIYCDFSGYSAIAIGLARVFGFDFGGNFDKPYLSRSFSEFWTRWHISLSSWLRDYLYIPLGGNRGGYWKTRRNLMLTMLLGGLWHGANWTFIAWGALHGLYLIGEKALAPFAKRAARLLRIPMPVWSGLLVVLVFHLTCLGWVFFRAPTFSVAVAVLRGIWSHGNMQFSAVEQRFLVVKSLVLILGLVAIEAWDRLRPSWRDRAERAHDIATIAAPSVPVWFDVPLSPAYRLAATAICLWLLALLGTFAGNAFIYFQF